MKRLLDIAIASIMLVAASPVLIVIALAIVSYDGHSPFYIAPRVGRAQKPFRMVKFRSMVMHADRSGVTSTAASDSRITPVGRFVRQYKLDELLQIWNVLKGDMSMVGPRPNVPSGVAVYTSEEMRLLSVRPGLTDFASIVFADEGDILKDQADPDYAYDQLIRPWKSRLGIFYIDRRSIALDLKLMYLTALAGISRRRALAAISEQLARMGADPALVRVSLREQELGPTLPPGSGSGVPSSH